MNKLILSMALASAFAANNEAFARTKLVTLPERQRIVLSLDNPQHALLYEEREIPLQQGTNHIDFAWSGVSLDPASVILDLLGRPVGDPDAVRIISTEYPPNENALTWQVYAPTARVEKIRVSYLLNGISQETSYELSVDQSEKSGDFRQYMLLRNQSGEDLTNAILRIPGLDDLTRSVDAGEARRFLAQRNRELPIQKIYVSRPGYRTFKGEDGESIEFSYELRHDDKADLGKSALPSGKVRIFGDDGMGSTIFLGEDMMQQIAPQEEGEIKLGTVRDVVLRRRLMKEERVNQKFNSNRQPVIFDQTRQFRYELENFRKEPVSLRIVEIMPQLDWELQEINDRGVTVERKSINELEITIELPASEEGKEVEKVVVDAVFLIKNMFPHEN